MSWTDVYPVFTEDQLHEYHESATVSEKEQMEDWYGIERVINPKPDKREIISVSLFWKNVRAGDPQLPTPTLNILQNAVDLGYARRFNPWDHYVLPLLDAFTWQCLREAVEQHVIFPNCGPLPIQVHQWPSYGFDEFFMNVAAYPRLAQEGMHTYVPGTASSQRLPLDIEYCTRGNPSSEIVYFPAGSCCGQLPVEETSAEEAEKAEEDIIDDHVETEWASFSLVKATLLLLETALKESDCTHFALVSESCVPVRSFTALSRSLQLNPRSRIFVRSRENERKTNVLRAQRVENLDGIRKEIAHFQAQWMCLNREDADLLCSRRLTDRFENCSAPDECYFARKFAVDSNVRDFHLHLSDTDSLTQRMTT